MSIIYDALKKVENSKNNKFKTVIPAAGLKKVNSYFIYAAVVVLGLFVGNLFLSFLTPKEFRPAKLKPIAEAPKAPDAASTSNLGAPSNKTAALAPQVKTEPQQYDFNLDGVFFSGDTAFALINDQVVQRGDIVSGALIRKISLDSVELEVKGRITTLLNRNK
ncbi:MAG: hypothetical protein WC628_01300 [Candidatus Omnitrophota bacterium]